MTETTHKEKNTNREMIEMSLYVIILAIVIAILLGYLLESSNTIHYQIEKTKIHSKLIVATKNGASLDDIKQLYLSSDRENGSNLLAAITGSETRVNNNKYYNNNSNFVEILKNIKAELYLQEKIDLSLITSIAKKINEHEQSNPFDKLEPNQRVHFEIIQKQLGDKYTSIQSNMNRIVDQMENKNKLVNEYLNDATMSYKISLFAFFIGLLALFPVTLGLWNWIKKKVNK